MARDTAIRFNLFHNLAIVALFENKRTKRLVQVATTHLLADPAFPDAKMLQTAILTSKLEELKSQPSYGTFTGSSPLTTSADIHNSLPQSSSQTQQRSHRNIPTILAGDFNSLPDSPVVQFLKSGQVDTCHFGKNDFGRFTRASDNSFHHHLGLADSYKSSALPFTNATRQFQGTIDYLLYDSLSLGLMGFLDHFETENRRIIMPSSPSVDFEAQVYSSSSDIDSEAELDMTVLSVSPSSTLSSVSSLPDSIRGRDSVSPSSPSIRPPSPRLDFSKLFQSTSGCKDPLSTSTSEYLTQSTSMTATTPSHANSPDLDSECASRPPLPTALPSEHFPSDHIPLVAIFRERDHLPA
ncbi:Glucose-repressible alcohol dehydrogenase transcriptional effector [Gryganskiella cystojenkinii]|nr:Glucose-repressible alcohol dehydrogenase transcriptional effector [Gryganskiella cystojenkinii]